MESKLLSPYQLIHPEKTTFRLKPPHPTKKCLDSSDQPFYSIQYQLYQKSWAKTNSQIAKIVDELQSGLLHDLITFIKTTKFVPQSMIRQSIPTAVILGASKILNTSLTTRINEIRNPEGYQEYLPVQLNSRTCLTTSSSIKSIVDSLEILLQDFSYSDNSRINYTEHDKKKTNGPSNPLARDDVENIQALYGECLHRYSGKSPFSSSSSSLLPTQFATESSIKIKSTVPQLIFLIDDFEGFDSCVLEDLICIFSNLLNRKIPIILVLSINTSADAIHSLLPRTVVFKLRMTPFAVDMSGAAVTSLIQRISLDPESEFDLSSGVIRTLMEGYDRLNKSIDVLISKLKFIHLAYFHTNPLIQLFDSVSSLNHQEEEQKGKTDEGQIIVDEKLIMLEGVPQKIQFIAHHLRLTASWKKRWIIHGKQPSKTPTVGDRGGRYYEEDEQDMIKILIESYKKRKMSRVTTGLALETLFRLSRFWPEKERTHEWVLYNIFRPELNDYSVLLCNLIKHSNDETVMNILTSILELLNNHPEFEWIEASLVKLSELIEDDQIRKTTGRSHLINTHEPILPGMKIFEADRDFSQIISNIHDALIAFFRKNLGPDSLLELNEAWTFDDKILLNQSFHPKFVHQLKNGLELKNKGLENPNKIPKEKDMEQEEEEGNEMKRMQKMYELYMETSGKMINLNDWFGAFYQQLKNQKSNIIEPNQTIRNKEKLEKKNLLNKGKKKLEEDENEVGVNFIKSIGDLGFLGIISPCSRKKEHVTKNFFGG